MMRRLIVRPEAEAEMTEAYDWYEDCVPGLGSEFLLCVDAVFSAIQRTPQQYPHVHKTHGVPYRAVSRTRSFLSRMTSVSSSSRYFMPSEIRNAGRN